MKNQRVFFGILLIGIGLFFLLDSLQLPFALPVFNWPMILLLIGIALLFHGLLGKESQSLFPGTLLCGLGIHFLALDMFPFWPRSWGMYTLIVGIAFFVQYVKTKKGLLTSLVLLIISIANLFYSSFQFWLSHLLSMLGGFWPLILIAIGVYFLFSRKK